MKRFLIQIVVFFGLVAVIDVCSGFGFEYLKSHAKGGDTYKCYYLAEKCEDDVLILGSSKAARHYVPSVFEDLLDLTCYNAGEPGCGIIPAYARYKMVVERHKPQLVVYEVTPGYDYFVSDDYSKYLGRIRQDRDKDAVRELYSSFGDKWDNVKALSNMYRNNSSIVSNVLDQFSHSNNKGYEPLYGVLSLSAIEKSETEKKKNSKDYVIDTLKLQYVKKLIQAAKRDTVPLVFVISPKYFVLTYEERKQYDEAIELAQAYSIPFLDCSEAENINGNRELFQDFVHLNNKGASLYTQKFVGVLQQLNILSSER